MRGLHPCHKSTNLRTYTHNTHIYIQHPQIYKSHYTHSSIVQSTLIYTQHKQICNSPYTHISSFQQLLEKREMREKIIE